MWINAPTDYADIRRFRIRWWRTWFCSRYLTVGDLIMQATFFLTSGGPREDTTMISPAGVVRCHAVDISPLRPVNQAIYLLTTGACKTAFRNVKTVRQFRDESICFVGKKVPKLSKALAYCRLRLASCGRPSIVYIKKPYGCFSHASLCLSA